MPTCKNCDRFWFDTDNNPKERGMCFREYQGKIYDRFGTSKSCPQYTPYIERTIEEEMAELSKNVIEPEDLPQHLKNIQEETRKNAIKRRKQAHIRIIRKRFINY
jgi:hypothetical protein